MKQFIFALLLGLLPGIDLVSIAKERPNLIFVLSDDIAQGDLGVYGQKLIQTPNLDRLANEGTRYLSAYTGTSVCAPARSSFFTGLHMGNCPTRANRELNPEGQRPLPADTVTIGKILKAAGYKTATMGKWGMGMFDTTGSPFKNGIDHFFGYNCQRHAHSYFPPYLYNDDKRFAIPENLDGKKNVYAQELIQHDVLKWVDENSDDPFFLFYAITLPHGRFEIDDQGIYADKPWTEMEKNYAAMVTRIDSDLGALVELLKKKGIADNTLIVFSGDNGSSFNPNTAIGKRFNQTMDGKLRGYKRGMYEGALRQAAFAWWPGTVSAGRVTDEPWAFWDLLPTFAELGQAKIPKGFQPDGFSLVEFFKGGAAPKRDYFYWELHENQPIQAIRWNDWKAVRPKPSGSVELYDLSNDLGETTDLASTHPDLVSKAIKMMAAARTAHPDWPDPATASPKKKKPVKKKEAPKKKTVSRSSKNADQPNMVYIMSDELAYYEVGYMGNEQLQTPRIDQMAREGLIFTRALAAAPVCAPLRASLMTGKHMGHCSVRANDGGTPLRAGEPTIASMLKDVGYATGGFGKWGAGGRDSTGVPEKHGFDTFFGYYDQVHAHSFYPPYLVRNSEEVILKGNQGGTTGETYSHYEIMNAGLDFIRDNADKPFFCYLPITPPHGMYNIPDTDPAWQIFKDKDWPEDAKRYAAMVKMVDRNVGEVLDLLKELKLEENTIVFFAGDNGGHDRFRTKEHPRGFFGPNKHPQTGVEFRGGKGNLYEGGLRIPSIVRWPGKIDSGQTSDLIWCQTDLFPTLAELAEGKPPADLDGISILPTILGEKRGGHPQEKREMLYWEYGGQTAVRMNNWKAIRPRAKGAWELYDLSTDISETMSIAEKHPEILAKMKKFAENSHTPARVGTYTSRTRHEKDRWAKWGTSKNPTSVSGVAWSRKGLIRSDAFKLIKVSSESKTNRKVATNIFDGDPGTWWHSEWSVNPEKDPHEIVVDLGDTYSISGFKYLGRQDNSTNGMVAECEFTILENADDQKGISLKHTFTDSKKIQEFKFEPIQGRFVRVSPLSEVNGKSWASIAELGVIGKGRK